MGKVYSTNFGFSKDVLSSGPYSALTVPAGYVGVVRDIDVTFTGQAPCAVSFYSSFVGQWWIAQMQRGKVTDHWSGRVVLAAGDTPLAFVFGGAYGTATIQASGYLLTLP